jgi:hypothetical protein
MGKTYRRDKRELEGRGGSRRKNRHEYSKKRRPRNNNFGRNVPVDDVLQDFVDEDE